MHEVQAWVVEESGTNMGGGGRLASTWWAWETIRAHTGELSPTVVTALMGTLGTQHSRGAPRWGSHWRVEWAPSWSMLVVSLRH